jgi:hypothetical protein
MIAVCKKGINVGLNPIRKAQNLHIPLVNFTLQVHKFSTNIHSEARK